MHTILLVDDQPVNRDFMRTLLCGRGYRLLEAGDGEEAFAVALRERPQLVVTDVVMPKADGYLLARRLAACPDLAGTRVIVCTAAYDESEARSLVAHCGIWRFLAKPTEPEVLLAAVEEALQEPREPQGRPAGVDVGDMHASVVNDKLHQKLAELEQLRSELERRVDERTRALQAEVQRRQQAQEALDRANARLRDEAMNDSLTGLYNRRFLDLALHREIAQAVRHDRAFSLLLIDIDHFKQTNDSFGHVAGDVLLQAVSSQLRRSFRAEDTICRYGGDEFVVLMPGLAPRAALDCAERLRAAVRGQKIVHDGVVLPPVTLSIGIASLTGLQQTSEAMLRSADRALYRVKQAGRDEARLSSDLAPLDDAPPAPARSPKPWEGT